LIQSEKIATNANTVATTTSAVTYHRCLGTPPCPAVALSAATDTQGHRVGRRPPHGPILHRPHPGKAASIAQKIGVVNRGDEPLPPRPHASVLRPSRSQGAAVSASSSPRCHREGPPSPQSSAGAPPRRSGTPLRAGWRERGAIVLRSPQSLPSAVQGSPTPAGSARAVTIGGHRPLRTGFSPRSGMESDHPSGGGRF
jgi:hypothetical protein